MVCNQTVNWRWLSGLVPTERCGNEASAYNLPWFLNRPHRLCLKKLSQYFIALSPSASTPSNSFTFELKINSPRKVKAPFITNSSTPN